MAVDDLGASSAAVTEASSSTAFSFLSVDDVGVPSDLSPVLLNRIVSVDGIALSVNEAVVDDLGASSAAVADLSSSAALSFLSVDDVGVPPIYPQYY